MFPANTFRVTSLQLIERDLAEDVVGRKRVVVERLSFATCEPSSPVNVRPAKFGLVGVLPAHVIDKID